MQDESSNHVGVNVYRSFTGGEGTPFEGMTTHYCIVTRLNKFNALSQGGHVYGLKPNGFSYRGAGEYTRNDEVPVEFDLKVEGLLI